MVGNNAAKQVGCRVNLGVFGEVRHAREHRRRPPRPFPTLPAARLFDQPVLGQLAQVEGDS